MAHHIFPGSTLGIIGGGQLGRMLTLEAKANGYYVCVLSEHANSPAAQVADKVFVFDGKDLEVLAHFAKRCHIVTFEFEHILQDHLEFITQYVPIYPSPEALFLTQNRAREKTFLKNHHLPIVPFEIIETEEELTKALSVIGFPCVLKTADFGYDGRGQIKLLSNEQALFLLIPVYAQLKKRNQTYVLERFVALQTEVSVVAARGLTGEYRDYDVIENLHMEHVLDYSCSHSRLPINVKTSLRDMTYQIACALNFVGVLCVEFFITSDGHVFINEIAPRPHNSGHLTIDACVCSQFEQQLRAVCGLPLGAVEYHHHAAMVNLLGDLWQYASPQWMHVYQSPLIKLHLYGKNKAEEKRKMGHLTVLSSASSKEALTRALTVRAQLSLR